MKFPMHAENFMEKSGVIAIQRWYDGELIASKTHASPVSLNEGKHLLHLNEEILCCALLDFQETTRNEFR